MRLLSRRGGFAEALGILRGNGCVGVLFDQNAGHQGALTLLLGRVCSSTELPGVLAAKFGAELRTFYPRRTAFWRVTFESEPVAFDGTAPGATLALNRWFEAAMADEDLCASWLWAHDRWRNQDVPSAASAGGQAQPPRRGPARPGPLRHAPEHAGVDAPAQLAGRRRRWRSRSFARCACRAPDAEITLLAKPAFAPLLDSLGSPTRCGRCPRRARVFAHFAGAARPPTRTSGSSSPTPSRGDLEARAAGCPQRFGIGRPGRRPGRSSRTPTALPEGFDESRHHQLELWEDFLRHFGLEAPPDCPLSRASAARGGPGAGPIGLIAGSENDPRSAGRSPTGGAHRGAFPGRAFVLLGTAGDAPDHGR
jgi:heptosyltransferase-2